MDGQNGYGGVFVHGSTLYGMTVEGGSSDDGIAFSISTSGGSINILHSFSGSGTDGAFPRGGLYMDMNSNLFGTASLNGSSNDGVVFKLANSTNAYSSLHPFTGSGMDGSYPWSTLVADSNGNLYGTTTSGGSNGYGVIFELVKSGSTFTYYTKYSFAGGTSDGATPYAGLTIDSSGNLWGTTSAGGAYGYGTVFEYTP